MVPQQRKEAEPFSLVGEQNRLQTQQLPISTAHASENGASPYDESIIAPALQLDHSPWALWPCQKVKACQAIPLMSKEQLNIHMEMVHDMQSASGDLDGTHFCQFKWMQEGQLFECPLRFRTTEELYDHQTIYHLDFNYQPAV